jgi:hypothetical protein
VEVSFALGVPDSSPLFAAEISVFSITLIFIPDSISDSTAIGLWLVAESAIITESRLAVLPADRANSVKTFSAPGIAKGSILLPFGRAVSYDLANTSAIGILPAVGGGCDGHQKSCSNQLYLDSLHLIIILYNLIINILTRG